MKLTPDLLTRLIAHRRYQIRHAKESLTRVRSLTRVALSRQLHELECQLMREEAALRDLGGYVLPSDDGAEHAQERELVKKLVGRS